jgi:UDP-N-acetyl-D-glucosamine dehydrogenase
VRVGIVGLGYVGLPLAVAFVEAGIDVTGVDVDAQKVLALARAQSYIEDIDSSRLAAARERLHATMRYADLAQTEAIIICVPTPLTANREPDLAPLLEATRSVGGVLQQGQLVVIESTTYPGTTREKLVPLLEGSGLSAGHNFFVAFSPERVDPGRTDHTLRTTPKVVGGVTDACLDRAVALYEMVCDTVISVSSPDVAELTKLLENIFRSVNIALVNELAIVCDRMGLDIWEVVEAAATKPYGFMRFDPGPGMGGHCLPVDPFYLTWRAREFGITTEFIELAGEVNQNMPHFCVMKIARGLNDRSMPIRGSRIAIIGVSYKPGVADLRESPALKIMKILNEQGAELTYHDDYVPYISELDIAGQSLPDALRDCNAAVIVTAHPGLDVGAIVSGAPLTVDLRGVTRGLSSPNLIRL